jgi:hypothetical protein
MKFSTLQTGGCHFDKWILPSERNCPACIGRGLIDYPHYNPSPGENQAQLVFL